MMGRLFQWLHKLSIKVLIGIESIIGLKFILVFFGANENTLIVKYIYSIANIFLFPFKGIFPMIHLDKFGIGGTIDSVSLSAAIGYLIAFFILSNIFRILGED